MRCAAPLPCRRVVASQVEDLLVELRTLVTGIGMVGELSAGLRDRIVSFGERLSVRLLAAHLAHNLGVPAAARDAWAVGLATDDNFGNAEVDTAASYKAIGAALAAGGPLDLTRDLDVALYGGADEPAAEAAAAAVTAAGGDDARPNPLDGRRLRGAVPIVTGFIGHDDRGRITTLGRGGSDLTATVLGAAVGADEVSAWKDVCRRLSR